jgi:hypothetical protein
MSAYNSYNWCGARVKNNSQAKFNGKMFTKVQATWKVPSFLGQPANGETWYAAIFVGLDGGSTDIVAAGPGLPNGYTFSQNLLQAGVAQKISRANGTTTQDCHAWYLWDAVGDKWDPNYSNNKVPGFAVSPGDTVTVTLVYKDPGKAEATFSLDGGAPISSGDFPVDAALFKGDTVEWIMERPADRNTITTRKKLGRFDPVRLYGASGSASDGSAVAPVAPNDGDTLIMEDDGHAHHLAEVTTVDSTSVSITFKAHI